MYSKVYRYSKVYSKVISKVMSLFVGLSVTGLMLTNIKSANANIIINGTINGITIQGQTSDTYDIGIYYVYNDICETYRSVVRFSYNNGSLTSVYSDPAETQFLGRYYGKCNLPLTYTGHYDLYDGSRFNKPLYYWEEYPLTNTCHLAQYIKGKDFSWSRNVVRGHYGRCPAHFKAKRYPSVNNYLWNWGTVGQLKGWINPQTNSVIPTIMAK